MKSGRYSYDSVEPSISGDGTASVAVTAAITSLAAHYSGLLSETPRIFNLIFVLSLKKNKHTTSLLKF
jgi:hypothetical protein